MTLKNGNSRDGVAAAEHLLAALLYSEGEWYGPTVELVFRNPNKGALTARTSYEVVNHGGWLRARRSQLLLPDWTRPALVRTRSPREALEAMARDAQGHLVKVSVECRDSSKSTCADVTFWDIQFERRNARNANSSKNNNASEVAKAAAARL